VTAHPETWFLVHSGPNDHAANMAWDEALLESMPRLGRPVLRFYEWLEPAASFGYFQKYEEVAQLTPLRPLVRRPTGGGIVPHAADWTYSLAFPAHHEWYSTAAAESYRRVHSWLQAAFASLQVTTLLAPQPKIAGPGQCFVGHEQSDLLWRGQKIAGAAQRRRRNGLLIQGSIQPPALSLRRADWEKAMIETARSDWQIEWVKLVQDQELMLRASALAELKYSRPAYNQKR